MPNFDGGHYFLTVLAPIKADPVITDDNQRRSRPDVLREFLACLPTAEQIEGSDPSRPKSPFARNNKTHLARFVVINDVVYNGRKPSDAILGRLGAGGNPIIPEEVDRLNRQYLLFAADLDTAGGDDKDLDAYLATLWNSMEKELRAIFGHCERFDEDVKDAGSFAAYIRKCQLVTTMPFNDYWANGLKAKNPPYASSLGTALVSVLALAVVIGIVLHLIAGSWLLSIIGGIVLAAVLAYAFVMYKGGKPFPMAPDSDLRSVLKALYLKQHFTDFAIANQGASDADLHKNFATFLQDRKPKDLDSPTQDPGVIRAHN